MEAWYGLDPGEIVMCTFVNRMFGAEELEEMEVNDPDIPGFTDKGVALGGGFYANGLPRTGFSPNRVTALPEQTTAKMYQASELKLTIPKLGLTMNITGVPTVDGEWDVSWLGSQAGYLMGTAYPTHEGNSVITAHVWDAYNNPGIYYRVILLRQSESFKHIKRAYYPSSGAAHSRSGSACFNTAYPKITFFQDFSYVLFSGSHVPHIIECRSKLFPVQQKFRGIMLRITAYLQYLMPL